MLKIIFLLFFAFALCQEDSGLRGAINESTVASFIKYISPEIIKEVSSIKIPDQSFTVKAGIKVKISLTEIGISISNFSPEIVNVDFEEPDYIIVTIRDLKAKGGFKGKFKWSFISNTERVDFDFKSVNVDMKLKILTRDADGKKLPNAIFEVFNLNYDFDFTFHGSLAKILKIVKSPIKKAITKAVNNIVKNQSDTLLKKAVEMIPPYVSINNKGYAIDYTFISPPTIKDNFLLFNSYGSLVNKNNPDTMTRHFPLAKNVPPYTKSGKQVQLYITDYVFNTALYTLYHTNSLEITVTPEMVPQTLPVKLNTNWLSTLIWGIDKTFGKEVQCEVDAKVRDSPMISFNEKFVELKLPTEIVVNARINETNYVLKQAVKIHSDFTVNVDFHIMEEGNITTVIHSIKMNNTKLNESAVSEANADAIEGGFNMIASLLIPSFNSYLKKMLNVTLPSVKGIKFNDMTVSHFTNYIAVEYNLTYENVTTVYSELDEQFKCPEGKIVKEIKLKKDKATGKMFYKVKCANKEYYIRHSYNNSCPNMIQ